MLGAHLLLVAALRNVYFIIGVPVSNLEKQKRLYIFLTCTIETKMKSLVSRARRESYVMTPRPMKEVSKADWDMEKMDPMQFSRASVMINLNYQFSGV